MFGPSLTGKKLVIKQEKLMTVLPSLFWAAL
jgi:hypothetical protein